MGEGKVILHPNQKATISKDSKTITKKTATPLLTQYGVIT